VVVNCRCDCLDPGLAWVGVKNSGFGCALSKYSFDSVTRAKSYHLKKVEGDFLDKI
jgi:acyl-CoA reductase-like NAD-dependent aldehyde dehydrogenase